MARRGIKGIAKDALRQDNNLRKQAFGYIRKKTNDMPTADSFINLAQNMGIGADSPLSTATYGFNPITRVRNILEWIHRGSWLGAAAIDLKADDMTRAGVDIEGTMEPSDMKEIEAETQRLNIWGALASTVKWAKLYGGSVGFLMIDGQDPRTPLRVETIGKGQFKGVLPLDKWMLEPSLQDLVTEYGPHIGKPKYYTINAMSPALPRTLFHHTRCIRLVGIELPYWQAMQENLWGISVLERVYDRMIAFDSATTGTSQLVYKAFLRTYKVKGMRELVGNGGRAYQGFLAQVNFMRRFTNTEGISVIDAEDELEIQGAQAFSGLSEALSNLAQQFAGAVQIPMVRLFGQSPSGFNSGDMDLRMYYDSILQEQNRDLRDGVRTIHLATAYSLGKQVPKDFNTAFRSLWQMTEKERAEVAEITGRTVGAAVEQGLMTPQAAAKDLKQASKETGIFSNITDKDINQLDDTIQEPLAEEVLGGAGGEGDDVPAGEGGNNKNVTDAASIAELETAYAQAEQKLAAIGNEPPKPSPESRAFGSNGREKADPAWVARYDESVRVYSRWRSQYSKLKKAEVAASNALFYVKQKVKDSITAVAAMKRIHDLDVVIENPRGTKRSGMGDDKKPFESVMPDDYGYIRRTVGDDGDQVDCFIGPAHDSAMAWIIQTLNPLSKLPDEQKVFLGYKTLKSALTAFLASYATGGGWERLGAITPMTIPALRQWLTTKV